MASESKTTTNHKTIQKWAEARGGKPASVKGTEKDGDAGLLRIEFPEYNSGDKLEEISWKEFFKKFDEKHLTFLYQEHTSSGDESRFFKFIGSDSAEHHLTGSTSHSKTHTTDAIHEPAPKTEPKTSEKAHKAEHKTAEKAQEIEHKTSEKAHKAEHKPDDKAHKEHQTEHKSTEKAHKASTHK